MGLDNILLNVSVFTETFARAGGGGSSSSGGGSGGDAIVIIFGYLPMHFVGSKLRKKIPIQIASIIGWILSIIYAFVLLNLGFYGFMIGIAALVGMGAGLYNWFDKIVKIAGRASKKQELAFQKDGAWDKAKLEAVVRNVFDKYQNDWSHNNAESMKLYMTPKYYYHNQLMVQSLKQINRRNDMISPLINDLQIVDVVDMDDNSKDSFVMYINASANDNLYDTSTNEKLYEETGSFEEYWRFVRIDNSNWLLDGIGQVTEDPYMRNNTIAAFAQSHNYCYSLDWGSLLLPKRGQIFKSGSFKNSDINNHVIGIYNNTLIQIYNYNPNPKQSDGQDYLIAQVALPKTYGNIVVRKKRLLSYFGTKGLTKISMEWGEFNKKYEVWASDMERATSFELLNPAFMVKLQELPFEVNIEVVDNIVYLYGTKIKSESANYETMLLILQQAFKEMRM